MWVEDEINIPLQKLNWWQKEKERKGENHTIFSTNNDADKAEAITDLKKPMKLTHQIYWKYEQNAEYSELYLSTTKERILADSV